MDFMQRYWFWPKLPISALLTHLYWCLLKNHKTTRLQTNEQTIFFKFLISKSFLLLWMFMDANLKKNHYSKHCKNSIFCFSPKSWFFRHVILKRPPIGQKWTPEPPGMAHMAGNEQNFWYFIKKVEVRKSVPQMCKTAWALGHKYLLI